ncbi:MAG: B12-binding domain-containing radical SAM protein [bacterium]
MSLLSRATRLLPLRPRRPRVRRYGHDPRPLRILLVAPRQPHSFWSLQGAVELFGARTLMPNAALATLMALTPDDVSVEYALWDENVCPDRPSFTPDLVAVTGTTVHRRRIGELCRDFRGEGLPVALGGPCASVDAELTHGLADHLFIGEAEHTWPQFLRDWRAGHPQPLYHQREPVDLADTPPPDWSLIDAEHYMVLSLQTSRGCPHRCDFCDVVRYMGPGIRVKPVDQIMTEVKNAHALGGRTVFFADDNFVGNRGHTREVLAAVYAWNSVQERPLSFSTQLTVNVADDEELLHLLAETRLSVAFVGVESVREESLREVHKSQNLRRDNRERLAQFSRHGIVPFLGLVVGFDHDDVDVFDEMYRFVEETNAPVVSLSVLNAPRGTPLYDRLAAEGRLLGDDFEGEWHGQTNIIPKGMTRQELLERHQELFRRLYDPRTFEPRLRRWLRSVEYFSPLYQNKRTDWRQLLGLAKLARFLAFDADAEVRRLFLRNIAWTLRHNPKLMRRTFSILAHFRHYYEYARDLAPTSP